MKLFYGATVVVVSMALLGAPGTVEKKTDCGRETADANEPIWGNTFEDVAVSIHPGEIEYRLGTETEVPLLIKNLGGKEVRVLSTTPFDSHKAALFDCKGRPVPVTDLARVASLPFGKGKGSGRRSGHVKRIKPGETIRRPLRLDLWFRIDTEGTYKLVVMQRLWSWGDGFAVSNMATVNVKKTGR